MRSHVRAIGDDEEGDDGPLQSRIDGYKKRDDTSKKDVKELISVFAKSRPDIDAALDRGEIESSRAVLSALRKTLIDLLPIAEKKYRAKESESTVYAYRALTEQLMSVMQDLRALDDRERVLDLVQKGIIDKPLVQYAKVVGNIMIKLADTMKNPARKKRVMEARVEIVDAIGTVREEATEAATSLFKPS